MLEIKGYQNIVEKFIRDFSLAFSAYEAIESIDMNYKLLLEYIDDYWFVKDFFR